MQHTYIVLSEDSAHIEQVAHSVAKVIHLLWNLYTSFINEQSDTCPLPNLAAPADEMAANALLNAISTLMMAVDDRRRVVTPPPELRSMVAEGLVLLKEVVGT